MLPLCNGLYGPLEWSNDFVKAIMIPREKIRRSMHEVVKISCVIKHSTKIILRILNRRIDGRINEDIKREKFVLRREKGTKHAISLLRTVGER